MNSVVTIQREVEKLKQALIPPVDIWVVFSFGPDDEPHGKYGYRKLQFGTGKVEAVSEAEELKLMREYYEDLKPECRPWTCFAEFLEAHRCKCPIHGKGENRE